MSVIELYILTLTSVLVVASVIVAFVKRTRERSSFLKRRVLVWHGLNLMLATALSFPVFLQSARLGHIPLTRDAELRVITANLWNDRSAIPIFIERVIRDRPHILFVQEAYEPWRSELARSLPDCKRIAGCEWPHNCNAVIYSRVGHETSLEGDGKGYVGAQLNLQIHGQQKRILLVSAHISRGNRAVADEQLTALRAFLAENPGPVILAGDFNLTPWDMRLQAILKDADLFRFSGLMPTWPTPSRFKRDFGIKLLSPGIVIDHVFASKPDFIAGNYKRFDFGSDHYGVRVDFGYRARSNSNP